MNHEPDTGRGGDLLTVAEAALRLRCHPETIRRYIAEGTLPATRLPARGARPGRWRILAADIDRLVASTAA